MFFFIYMKSEHNVYEWWYTWEMPLKTANAHTKNKHQIKCHRFNLLRKQINKSKSKYLSNWTKGNVCQCGWNHWNHKTITWNRHQSLHWLFASRNVNLNFFAIKFCSWALFVWPFLSLWCYYILACSITSTQILKMIRNHRQLNWCTKINRIEMWITIQDSTDNLSLNVSQNFFFFTYWAHNFTRS